MTPVTNGLAPRRIGVAGAFLLIGASAALGAYFGFTVGAHVHVALGVVFAAAALGGDPRLPSPSVSGRP